MSGFIRQQVSTGFGQVPNGLWTMNVSVGARVLLGWLHSHTDEFLASLTANKCRRAMGTSSVAGWLAELEAAGFVTIERTGGHRDAWSFTLLADPWVALCDRAETGSVDNLSGPRRNRRVDRAETGALTAPKPARVEEQREHTREDQAPLEPPQRHRRRRTQERVREFRFYDVIPPTPEEQAEKFGCQA